MTNPPPSRRRFAFSLRAILLALTFTCVLVCLAPDAWLTYRRHSLLNWIRASGGRFESFAELDLSPPDFPPPPTLSRVRRWLGDEPIAVIWLPMDISPAAAREVRAIFPEAASGQEADQLPRTPAGLGPGGMF